MVAEFYTSAALGLLTWWVDHDFRHGPARLAHMYQRLAGSGLPTALGHTPGDSAFRLSHAVSQ